MAKTLAKQRKMPFLTPEHTKGADAGVQPVIGTKASGAGSAPKELRANWCFQFFQ